MLAQGHWQHNRKIYSTAVYDSGERLTCLWDLAVQDYDELFLMNSFEAAKRDTLRFLGVRFMVDSMWMWMS